MVKKLNYLNEFILLLRCFLYTFFMFCVFFLLVKSFCEKNKKFKTGLMTSFILPLFFSIRVFFHGHWRLTGQQGKGEDHLLFHSTTSTRSRTFRHLVATLHMSWLSYIFNRTTCIYQTATRWNLPPYRITVWLIDDAKLCEMLV